MFGALRTARATQSALEAIRPLITACELRGPIPERFWDEAYILGYLNGVLLKASQFSAKGKLRSIDMGQIMLAVYRELGADADRVCNMCENYLAEDNEHYLFGMERANKAFAVALGSHEFDNDQDVLDARALDVIPNFDNQFPEGFDRTVSNMQFLHFVHVVNAILHRYPSAS